MLPSILLKIFFFLFFPLQLQNDLAHPKPKQVDSKREIYPPQTNLNNICLIWLLFFFIKRIMYNFSLSILLVADQQEEIFL